MTDQFHKTRTVVAVPDDRGVTAPATASDDDGAGRLLRLAVLGEELGAESVSKEVRALADPISEGRFYVACIGQFKRGKSTLINALIGEPILPVGFIPITAVPSVIRFGERPRVRIQARDGSWRDIAVSDLKQYVSEEHNPENTKKVGGVEVFVPSPLLAAGMCLVDTPGLGSVFTGNTAATQAFIPHIDAALVVVGADPPLAGEKLTLVEAVGRQVLNYLLEMNCARVQSDVLNRVQESRSRLEVEIRKLLHEVKRIAEQALTRARAVRSEGAAAVQAAFDRLDNLEREIRDTRTAQ
jgi:hypothetical protein